MGYPRGVIAWRDPDELRDAELIGDRLATGGSEFDPGPLEKLGGVGAADGDGDHGLSESGAVNGSPKPDVETQEPYEPAQSSAVLQPALDQLVTATGWNLHGEKWTAGCMSAG